MGRELQILSMLSSIPEHKQKHIGNKHTQTYSRDMQHIRTQHKKQMYSVEGIFSFCEIISKIVNTKLCQVSKFRLKLFHISEIL